MSFRERLAEAVDRVERSTAGIGRSVASIHHRIDEGKSRRRIDAAKLRLAPGTMDPLHGWSCGDGSVDVAILVYRGVSSAEVEVVGDALARPLGARVRLVSAEPGNVVAVEPPRLIVAEPLAEVTTPYGLVIPGGLAWKREAGRAELVAWLTTAVEGARGIIAVSTGSLLLAATGVLEGQSAAGHWLAGDLLAELGASPSTERIVHGRLLVTASGALAGAEAAAELAREMRFSI